MPEYLAPGVYVEEVSYRARSIEGVSTTTTGFVGPARFGPTDMEPSLLTDLSDFERIYGDGEELEFSSGSRTNYLWHAVRAFFFEGGQRLYVSRVVNETSLGSPPRVGRFTSSGGLTIHARHPGLFGNFVVEAQLTRGPNIRDGARYNGLRDRDTVIAIDGPPSPSSVQVYVAHEGPRDASGRPTWTFHGSGSPGIFPTFTNETVHVLTANITVRTARGRRILWARENVPLDPNHKSGGVSDSLTHLLNPSPANEEWRRRTPISLTVTSSGTVTGVEVAAALDTGSNLTDLALRDTLDILPPYRLGNATDGDVPTPAHYEGTTIGTAHTGLRALENIEEISIVAAPGATHGYEGNTTPGDTIIRNLIGHAERMRYRIAVLDSGQRQSSGQVQAMRGRIDSKYAALYYPWIRVLNPLTQEEINLPPSGFVTGIYARNDVERAVFKAPANEVVRLAIGFESSINKAQQEVLNPRGINCFRSFENRGLRLWGARTISSDPEWKYVNLRRYFIFLEASIDRSTQWVVFEPNGERLWANVRRAVEDFLFNQWRNGALLGETPEVAYFVRCDRSTMDQNDLDNGRLICEIGVAALRPAEFVIFRIGQWTADAQA